MNRAVVRRTLLTASLAAAVLALPAVAGADGGTYTQYACHLPDGTVAPTDGFTLTVGGLASGDDRCASGGGLDLRVPTTSDPESANVRWTYTPPPGTKLAHVGYQRVVTNIGSPNAESTRVYTGATANSTTPGDRCGWYGPCAPGPVQVDFDEPTAPLEFLAYCEYQACHGPEPGDGTVTVDRIAITLRDDADPTVPEAPSGDLLASGPISGTRTVSFHARDEGGGVYQAALIVDGTEQPRVDLDDNVGACRPPFTHAVPCSQDLHGSVSVDTGAFPDGIHNVSLVVYDVTGSNKAVVGPFPVQIENHPHSSGPVGQSPNLTASNTAGERTATALYLKNASRRLVVGFGRLVSIAGTLRTTSGTPVPSATVRLVDIAFGTPLGVQTTDSRGRFAFHVRSTGNRRLEVRTDPSSRYLPSRLGLGLYTPMPLRLAPSRTHLRNRQVLTLRAALAAAIPEGSARVSFQVKIGQAWRTFAVRRVSREGSARVDHEFRVTYQPLVYRFRAVVDPLTGHGFPFVRGHSNVVTVRVN